MVRWPHHPGGARNQFATAIQNVFKFVNQNEFGDTLSLSKKSTRVLNDLLVDAFQKLLAETQILMVHENQRIMTSRSLDLAVQILFRSPATAHKFRFYARKAVCDYLASNSY